jgi:hypothetical protein
MERSTEKMVKNVIAMARGTLVIDENSFELVPAFSSSNFHIIKLNPGEKDEDIVQRLLPNRMIITKNPVDFKKYASSFDIGIIDISKLKFVDPDPSPTRNTTFHAISEAIIKHSLWSVRHGFIITLYDNKEAIFTALTD